MRTPRTKSDFTLIEHLARAGHSDLTISKLFNLHHEWRSQVVSVNGDLHCASCYLPIGLRECLECGQTISEGAIYE